MQRLFVNIIKEICEEQRIFFKSFSYSWIFELEYNGITRHIIGYQLGLNSSSAAMICKDKSAASDILMYHDIPCVSHELFLTPSGGDYTEGTGNWGRLAKLLDKYKKLVCKPNEGTGGMGVFMVSSPVELERASEKIFKFSRTMAVCPYYDIENEYRVIILEGKVRLIFSKDRPYVEGDGKNGIIGLISKKYGIKAIAAFVEELKKYNDDIVLKENQKFYLKWKHNLCEGAKPHIINHGSLYDRLSHLAETVAKALGTTFASIDIIGADGRLMVLEVNGSVMMEYFAASCEENYQKAKGIYTDALRVMFNIK